MSRRTIALVVAVALAAVATIVLLSYVTGIEDRALQGQEPVEVFRAKDAIPAGVSADQAQAQGLIERVSVPNAVRPQGAIVSLEQISGRVAAINILPGEILVDERFVQPGQVGGGLSIPSNRVAISVQVGIPPGVAGYIRQGDSVSMMAQLDVPRGTGTTAETITRVQFVIQDVEVLSIGRRVVTVTEQGQTEGTESPADQVLLTLAVTPGQAERVAFATLNGQLYFTLLPPDAKAVKTNGRTARNTFP